MLSGSRVFNLSGLQTLVYGAIAIAFCAFAFASSFAVRLPSSGTAKEKEKRKNLLTFPIASKRFDDDGDE